jgi:DNA-binding winged helix-turn-helix (wHTH) protein
MDYERNRTLAGGQIVLLSPQETELMSIFVADPAFTFTVPELADKLWGNNWPTDIQASVGRLVLRLRRKLAATRLRIVAIPGHGYGLRQIPAGSQFAAGRLTHRESTMTEHPKENVEETSLPAHVALCHLRYRELARRLARVETAVYVILAAVLLGGERAFEIAKQALAGLR